MYHHLSWSFHQHCLFGSFWSVPDFWTTQYVEGIFRGAVHLALVIVVFGRQSLCMVGSCQLLSGESFSL